MLMLGRPGARRGDEASHAKDGGTRRREQHALTETSGRRPLSRECGGPVPATLNVTGARAFDGDQQAGFFVDVHFDGSPSVTALRIVS